MSRALENVSGWEIGQLAALVHKLGAANARSLLSCDEVSVTINSPQKQAEVTAVPGERPVWKTVLIGTHTTEELLRELDLRNFSVDADALKMMSSNSFSTVEREEEIDLFMVTPQDLGIVAEDERFDVICHKAAQQGYELCPPELGPKLRLQYIDQPMDEFLFIAMDPFVVLAENGEEQLHIFTVHKSIQGGLWLGTNPAFPDDDFYEKIDFIFCRRKRQTES